MKQSASPERLPCAKPRRRESVTRVVVADDHPFVRRGLRQFLDEQPGLRVVGECADGIEALAALRSLAPDVIILDIQMPRLSGLQVLETMKADGSPAAAVLLVASISDEEMLLALRHGVRGVVLKQMDPELLVQCVRKVAAGGQWLEKESVGRLLERMIRSDETDEDPLAALTGREREVMLHVAGGLTNRQIAATLYISEGTVKSHLHAVYEKLGVNGRMRLSLLARQRGLVTDVPLSPAG
jgi:DNA-binding NarL/FixJ family response regulator